MTEFAPITVIVSNGVGRQLGAGQIRHEARRLVSVTLHLEMGHFTALSAARDKGLILTLREADGCCEVASKPLGFWARLRAAAIEHWSGR